MIGSSIEFAVPFQLFLHNFVKNIEAGKCQKQKKTQYLGINGSQLTSRKT